MPEPTTVKTVLCVPGPWREKFDLMEALLSSSEYLLAGNLLYHVTTKEGFHLDIQSADPQVTHAFSIAGYHWASTPEMNRIADHQMVVYIVGEGGSPESAGFLMEAAEAFLAAGGFGVKIESSGLAHSPAEWRRSIRLQDKGLHHAYVVYLQGNPTYSCGMHNLGYKDAVIDKYQAEDPIELLRIFTRYMVVEKPVLGEGHTFQASLSAPAYRMTHEPCAFYDEDSLFTNPFGLWRLRLKTD